MNVWGDECRTIAKLGIEHNDPSKPSFGQYCNGPLPLKTIESNGSKFKTIDCNGQTAKKIQWSLQNHWNFQWSPENYWTYQCLHKSLTSTMFNVNLILISPSSYCLTWVIWVTWVVKDVPFRRAAVQKVQTLMFQNRHKGFHKVIASGSSHAPNVYVAWSRGPVGSSMGSFSSIWGVFLASGRWQTGWPNRFNPFVPLTASPSHLAHYLC